MFFSPQPLHFVGIGGIGMSGLAEIMHGLGCRVQGSDLKLSSITARLEGMGVKVWPGHSASHLPPELGAVIVTSAASAENPEVLEARRRGVPIVKRGELLAELMRTRSGVAVGGSHGKTTTTSMLATIVLKAGLDPTVVVGGLLPVLGGSNARLGKGSLLITESDESDGSFLDLMPILSVITNVDREHLDHYGTFDRVREAFLDFANRVPFYGCVVACLDDAELRGLLPGVRRRVVTYGEHPEAGLRLANLNARGESSRFDLLTPAGSLGSFVLPLPGRHNAANAAAAAAVSLELGVDPELIRAGLAEFRGAGRRMELKGQTRGVTVLDDYGHHPAEIRATLQALRLREPSRLVVLFQPHRYTRTQALLDEFGTCFAAADSVRITDIYAASEPPIEGVTGEAVAASVRGAGHRDALYAGPLEQAIARLAAELQPGDVVVTLGAGSVTEAGPKLLALLKEEDRHGA